MKRTAAALFLMALSSPAFARPRLLLLGDSLTAQYFGRRLDARLRAGLTGYDVETHGYCSSQPAWFLRASELSPGLKHYSGMDTTCGFFDSLPSRPPEEGSKRPAPIVDDLGPAGPGGVAVVALGTNLTTWDDGKLGYFGMDVVSQLARKLRGLGWRCVWVGPPVALDNRWKDLPGAKKQSRVLSKAVRKAADGCDYIDSIALTKALPDPRQADGLHYKQPAAEAWADAVYAKLRRLIPAR